MIFLLLLLVAITASFSGFIVHVFTVEWLPAWIEVQMQEVHIQSSWNVRYIAGVMSIEYGIAAVVLYYLAREKLIGLGRFKAALTFSILLMSLHGAFVRQPLMDYLIGNPLHVVLVQNCFKWLVWLLMSFLVIYGFELVKTIKNGRLIS